MLLVYFPLRPAESIQELYGSYWLFASLEVIEYSLQAKRDWFEVLNVNRHVVHSFSEGFNNEESLYEGVKVASCTFIDKPVILMEYLIFSARSGSDLIWQFLNKIHGFDNDTNIVHFIKLQSLLSFNFHC